MQRVLNDETSYLFTWYVYDDFGNLRFMIPPEAFNPEALNNLPAANYTFVYDDVVCRRWVFAYTGVTQSLG